jgi:hypothetical protein
MKKPRKRWCVWADKPCPATCPIPSVDNFGHKYPGCALVRLKSKAELDAEIASLRSNA